MDYTFLLELALILIFTKVLGILMKKLGLPQVVGAIIAGLLLGGAVWSPLTGGRFIPVSPSAALTVIAEIGVVMIMFSAGLETDLKELKSTGPVAMLIATFGVVVPLGLGFLIAMPFFGTSDIHGVLACVFVGVIITATSVSITVETLKELGKLKGKVGTAILSAAIIDDVIGIIILTVVMGLKNPSAGGAGAAAVDTIVKTVLFFVVAIGAGLMLNRLFKWLVKKYPHRRRVPIMGLAVCFIYAYVAEHFFGIADITGAYLAGIILSNLKETGYIEHKVDVGSYMIFSPVFFAAIGIKTTFEGMTLQVLLFALLFVLAGIGGKIIGCGGAAKLCRFSVKDSLKIGVGMIARGEVALIVAQKGMDSGIIPPVYLSAVIVLVIVSSLLAPILLKVLFKTDKQLPLAA